MRSVSTIKQPTNMQLPLADLAARQLAAWPLARTNYEALHAVRTRRFMVDGCELRLQFNPARIRSTAARVDARSVGERPCFLCPDHLPAEQMRTPWGDGYLLLLNPYPIFPTHFTLPALAHTPQTLAGHTLDFIRTTRALEGFTVFYNGPRCGASAPDHLHFQAGNRGFLPLENEVTVRTRRTIIPADTHGNTLYTLPGYLRPLLVLRSANEAWADEHLQRIISLLPTLPGETEPRFNLLGWHDADGWTLCLFPRTEHRPRRFYAEGTGQLLLSPASVDLAGVFITPREEDFLRITPHDLRDTLREVTPSPDEMERIIRLLEE